ncbi:heavy metal translocating P-type ATPase [Frigidibacter sp. ROC022]|uniref:heavy metal translocating P-type ATPase n=1 Tax=Frigidibacter sp. ROC022 TaxID=2971796 RepID=UPI00215B5D5A|nr:heavy metal translocating P-type ATPase [Frigidibacter sp. ROC022]MCR8723438.1 heavy metal translocating P-type ATPase [Frigidibacter sp. ROC022]
MTDPSAIPAASAEGAGSLHLPIEGMTCASCVRRVERAIAKVPGVLDASVNLATQSAEVSFAAPAQPADLRAAVEKAGYEVPQESVVLSVEGATCASCVRRIEAALARVPGVEGATMNLATNEARLSVLRGASLAPVLAALARAGYPAKRKDAARPPLPEADRLRPRLILAALLTLPVFVLEMGGHLIPAWHHLVAASIGQQTSWVIQFLLTTAVLAGPGRMFFAHGVPGLLRGAPDMNALVALGAGAAWAYSTVATFAPGWLPEGSRSVWFEAAAVIVTLILLGRWLEARAKGRAGAAIRHLLDLTPATARVERDGSVVEVPVAELAPGAVLHLRPGERVAVDGVVLSGESHVDESMLTGESAPVAKSAGDSLTGGTVNGLGALTYRAEAVGDDTRLAQIVRLVEQAQGAKLPVQNLVDRITQYFVPAVLAVALVTLIAWLAFGPGPGEAMVAAVSVLIIACPCAMGLAVPVSIMVGTGRGAELGVLFRRGDALQTLAGVRQVAFDKTGTLTEGHPALTDCDAGPELLARVAAVEALSEHPLGRAVVVGAEARGLALPEVSGFAAVVGQGVRAEVAGHALRIGNARFLRAEGVDPAPLEARAEALAQAGRTPLLVAEDEAAVAVLGVSDPVKPGAAPALRALEALGIGTVMLTGDAEAVGRAVGAGLGIGSVRAGLGPEDKVAALAEMRRSGPVAFVGDGINDAPVLAGADVGLAIGTGTDVAIEAAEVVLTSGDPRGVATAVGLSRAVMRNIRQNLAWAFGYNILLIPVAAGVFTPWLGFGLTPALAAGAMAMSSVLVVSNALRLRRFGRHRAGAGRPGQPVAAVQG